MKFASGLLISATPRYTSVAVVQIEGFVSDTGRRTGKAASICSLSNKRNASSERHDGNMLERFRSVIDMSCPLHNIAWRLVEMYMFFW